MFFALNVLDYVWELCNSTRKFLTLPMHLHKQFVFQVQSQTVKA